MNDARFLDDLRARCDAADTPACVFFWGHQPGRSGVTASCFSQWFEAVFEVDGQRYPTAEHFMMAEKAALFDDQATRAAVLQAATPAAAKALGRQVRGFDEATWLAHRFDIVVRANLAKFAQHEDLRRFLLDTDPRVLVEASPVDRVWGIGLAANDDRAQDPRRWDGLNLLGFALMQVRAQLAD